METYIIDKNNSSEKKYKERKSIKIAPKNIEKYNPKENQLNLRKTMPKKIVSKEQKRERKRKRNKSTRKYKTKRRKQRKYGISSCR